MISLTVIIICFICILVLISYIADDSRKKKTKISFKESMDLTELPVITFYNKDQKLNFLLDTGSNISHLTSSILPSLEFDYINKEMPTIGMEGNKVTNKFCRMTVQYKNQKYEEEFSISNLDNAFNVVKQESGVQIHGILGSKFFEKYKYILDFSELIAYTK